MKNKNLNVKFIKLKKAQNCDICKKASKIVCINEEKILCKNCYYKLNPKTVQKTKQKETNNKIYNPKMCIAKKVGVHCNICNQLVTTFQKFQSGKCICISCFNKMTDGQIKKLKTEEYNADNTIRYKNPYNMRFMQGGNP